MTQNLLDTFPRHAQVVVVKVFSWSRSFACVILHYLLLHFRFKVCSAHWTFSLLVEPFQDARLVKQVHWTKAVEKLQRLLLYKIRQTNAASFNLLKIILAKLNCRDNILNILLYNCFSNNRPSRRLNLSRLTLKHELLHILVNLRVYSFFIFLLNHSSRPHFNLREFLFFNFFCANLKTKKDDVINGLNVSCKKNKKKELCKINWLTVLSALLKLC